MIHTRTRNICTCGKRTALRVMGGPILDAGPDLGLNEPLRGRLPLTCGWTFTLGIGGVSSEKTPGKRNKSAPERSVEGQSILCRQLFVRATTILATTA